MLHALRRFGLDRAIAAAVVVGGGGATAYQASRVGTAVAATMAPVPPVPPVVVGAGEVELIGALVGNAGRWAGGAVVLGRGEQVRTPAEYAAPVTVHVVAFAAGSTLQFGVAGAWVSFGRGPGGETMTVGTGDRRPVRPVAVPFPGGRWVDVAVHVDRGEITVAVDGERRYAGTGDFSKLRGPVVVFVTDDVPVRVGSVRMTAERPKVE